MNPDYKEIQLESYSGYKDNERPIAFTYEGEHFEIQEIVDRWYEGSLDSKRSFVNYFKVKTVSGKIFILRYQPDLDTWSLQMTNL